MVDDRLRIALNGALQGQQRDGRPAVCSIATSREAVRMHNRALGSQEPDIRYLNAFETVVPTYPPNDFYGLLDAMPRASYVARYEMVTSSS